MSQRWIFVLLPLLAASVGACSASPGADVVECPASGSATVNGALLGSAFQPKDAMVLHGAANVVVVTDFAGACTLGDSFKAGSNVLMFAFGATPEAGTTIAVGGDRLAAQYAHYDSACRSPQGEAANAGSVTITESSSCGLAGTFELTMNGEHVTGSFSAPACGVVTGGDAPACE